MRLQDLLAVLRDEFAQAAGDIDAALGAWMGDEPANAPLHNEPIFATFSKLAEVSRMVGLEGHAQAIERLRDAAQLIALSDERGMAEALSWLAMWREPLAATFDHPGDALASQALLDHLALGPVPPAADAAQALRLLLVTPPTLPRDDDAAVFAAPSDNDVSIAVPGDVDAGLYETFLAEAPDQLAALGDTVRELARGAVDPARVVEAQRIAHTFKGSGNIIGIRGVGQMAHRMEDLLEFAVQEGGLLPLPMARDLESAAATLDQMVFALRGDEEAPTDALLQLSALIDWARAIDDGSWPERVAQRQQTQPAPASEPAATRAAAPTAQAPSADAEAQVRVPASRVDRLVRQAGQSLVQHGRMAARIKQLDQRLMAMSAAQAALSARLRDLTVQIDRQGVSLQEKADHDGARFDPLEMDRYNELHALTRFVAEMAADSDDLTKSARDDVHATALELHDHERALKAQHGELLRSRLLPFRHIAARLRRNVSQTAATTGKQVQLVIEGEQVQLDGDVLDRLTEPLLHLLRNAMDHGVENSSARAAQGKPSTATIRLRANRQGEHVVVEVSDDGRGIDVARVRQVARERNTVSDEILEAMSDTEAIDLIFAPGFSTASEVTDLSGRGVGLDAVRTAVERLAGRVGIESRAGQGTTVRVTLPFSVMMTRVMTVEAGGQMFGIALDAIVETVRIGVDSIVPVGAAKAIVLRNRTLPLVELAGALGVKREQSKETEASVVVARIEGHFGALHVDRLGEQMEVMIKPLDGLLSGMPGIAGSTLLGDGSVLLVLDLGELLQ